MKGIITLITDFGHKDPFVGIMKGVMLDINPDLVFVDISHGILPHNVLEAALTLQLAYSYFPKGTIHLVVVDPGVGGDRSPLVVSAAGYFFIGPDNGVLSLALGENDGEKVVMRLSATRYFRKEVSSTFHGRDIFAPAAAWISQGIALRELGTEITNYRVLAIPEVSLRNDSALEGEIISCDQFGNLISNISRTDVEEFQKKTGKYHQMSEWKVKIGQYLICGLKKSYEQGASHQLSAVFNSFNYLEIFLFKDNAQRFTQLKLRERVILCL